LSSVVVKSIDEGDVRRAADAWVKRLLDSRPEVEEVVVFGSFARGTFAPGSDLDVLIVLTQSRKPFRDRIPDYLPGSFPVGVDVLPYTRAELESSVSPALIAEVKHSEWSYVRPGISPSVGENPQARRPVP
jgi:predicted nucleotidyltransferase